MSLTNKSVSQIENLHFGGPDQNYFYCRIRCEWVLENTWSKRHGLIQLRSTKFVHFTIACMKAIYEGNECVPCAGMHTIEDLFLSVLDFEYSTLKTIKFGVVLYKLIFI